MANIQVGKYVYNSLDLPLTAKVLNVLQKRTAGVSAVAISELPEIKSDFNGDAGRAHSKVKTLLSNLRFRSVVSETQNGNNLALFRITNKDDALTLITEGAKIAEKTTQRTAEAATIVKETAGTKSVTANSNTKKVNTMTAAKKPAKLFLNPETNKIEPFGAGRPSKLKTACECNAEGKYLNPQAAAAFIENGGKDESKLTKSELLDMLRKVRAERDEALAAVEVLKSVMVSADEAEVVEDEDDSVEAEADETDEVSADDAEVTDDGDDLDLEAEAVDSDDGFEADEAEVG